MKWISTGRQLGQAVKNVQRLRQILSVFARHGFSDVLHRMNLGKFIPGSSKEQASEIQIPERLRKCFEELGPTFVKFGQILSTRSDILSENYIEEFKKLQDNVAQVPFSAIKSSIEKELGKPIDQAFLSFEKEPLASASIAQVHEARLHDGTKVVVKVQRPEIRKIIDTDISLMAFLAKMANRYVPEARIFEPEIIVDEFFRSLKFETDFIIEANNMNKIRENMASFPEIVVPKVYKSLSTSRILTQERFEGIRVNDVDAIEKAGIDKKRIVDIGARAFFRSILIDGAFHGDLHGGNLFILPGNRLGIIDFGIVGRLSQKSRDQLANMVLSLITEDYENLCYQYAELGAADSSIDFDGFQREVRNTISPYLGLNLSEVNTGKVLTESTRIATKYNIRIPGDWMLVFKAIVTTEGMGRDLDPSFDMFALVQELVKDLVKNQYSLQRISKDFLWIAKDLAHLLQVLPRQIRWMFRKFNRNDFAFEIKAPELRELTHEIQVGSKRSSLSMVATGLFVSSALSLGFSDMYMVGEYPLVAVIFFGMGLMALMGSLSR